MADVGHACDEGQTEESSPGTTGTIRRVPRNLLGVLISRITHYLENGEDISAEIHEYPRQPAKLVLSLIGAGEKEESPKKQKLDTSVTEDSADDESDLELWGEIRDNSDDSDIDDNSETRDDRDDSGDDDLDDKEEEVATNVQPFEEQKYGSISTDTVQEDSMTTNKILVKNFPPAIDEDMLEVFFESKKKTGGGPVKNVQLNKQKNWAVVEFYEADVVKGVMSQVPITMMATELDIRPYTPLLQGEGFLESLAIHNLPKELTDDLLTMHIEGAFEASEISSAEYLSDGGEEDLKNADLSMERPKGFVKETITCLQPVQLKILQMTNYTKTVLEQLPEIKVELDLERNEVSFEGDAKTFLSGYKNLLETICKFGLNRLDNKLEEHIGLYKRQKGYIDRKLKAQNFVCAWEVSKQELVICSQEEQIVACTKLIDEAITEIKFPICKESSATLITQEWEKEVKQLHEKKKFLLNVFSDNTSTIITVIATDKEISGIVSHIKEYLKRQLDMTKETFLGEEKMSAKFKLLYDVDSLLAHRVLEQIKKGLSLHHVQISITERYYRGGTSAIQYDITGTRQGVELVKKRIDQLDISF